MPYRCMNCGHVFCECKYVSTTYEDYYGVAFLEGSKHQLTLEVCPNCGDEDIDEIDEDEEDDE